MPFTSTPTRPPPSATTVARCYGVSFGRGLNVKVRRSRTQWHSHLDQFYQIPKNLAFICTFLFIASALKHRSKNTPHIWPCNCIREMRQTRTMWRRHSSHWNAWHSDPSGLMSRSLSLHFFTLLNHTWNMFLCFRVKFSADSELSLKREDLFTSETFLAINSRTKPVYQQDHLVADLQNETFLHCISYDDVIFPWVR